jgi:hypothetical protein
MFSFARRALLWPATAAVKARDELAALGLDSRLASHKLPDIRAKENIRYDLTQPQSRLTSTGLLMEGPGHLLTKFWMSPRQMGVTPLGSPRSNCRSSPSPSRGSGSESG